MDPMGKWSSKANELPEGKLPMHHSSRSIRVESPPATRWKSAARWKFCRRECSVSLVEAQEYAIYDI